MSETTQRPGSVPASINPKEYRALEDLRSHCRREGVTLIDRVYADAAKMYLRLKEVEDLAGLSQPAPKPKMRLGPGWTPSYNDPDNHGDRPEAEPEEIPEGEEML
jgi:hypothetical protein